MEATLPVQADSSKLPSPLAGLAGLHRKRPISDLAAGPKPSRTPVLTFLSAPCGFDPAMLPYPSPTLQERGCQHQVSKPSVETKCQNHGQASFEKHARHDASSTRRRNCSSAPARTYEYTRCLTLGTACGGRLDACEMGHHHTLLRPSGFIAGLGSPVEPFPEICRAPRWPT